MKHFIYTVTEGKPPRDGSGIKRTVVVYRVKRNIPQRVATLTETFMSEFQMVMTALEQHKLLPKAAFARHPHSCGYAHGVAWALKEAGFATVTRV